MGSVLVAVVGSLVSFFRSRPALQLEVLALRHQLAVYQRSARRPRLQPADRLLSAWLGRAWSAWRDVLIVVQPRTVLAWQRKRFRAHWSRWSRHTTPGRPRLATELRKPGITIAKATVERYMVRCGRPPSPTWRTFAPAPERDPPRGDHVVRPWPKQSDC